MYSQVDLIRKKHVEKNKLATSYNWLVERRKQGLWYRLMNILGPDWNKPMFILLQFCYTILVMLPCYLFYYRLVFVCIQSFVLYILFFSLEANILAIMVFMCVACWNGGQYYIDIFSERYHLQFEKLDWTMLIVHTHQRLHFSYIIFLMLMQNLL